MKVVFVRHGESTGNAGISSHDLSMLELTERGQAQARAIAGSWTRRPDLIVTSPYLRTKLTAAPSISRFPSVSVSVLPMEEFTYLEPARWNGTSRQSRLPHIEAFWFSADPAYCDGSGAESFDTLLSRVRSTFDQLNAMPQGSLVYAFSHGQFMQATRLRLNFPTWSSTELMQRFWSFDKEHPIPNGGRICAEQTVDVKWRVCEAAEN